jgi:hypothetical protein
MAGADEQTRSLVGSDEDRPARKLVLWNSPRPEVVVVSSVVDKIR